MRAPVLAFDSAPAASPSKRGDALQEAWHDAHRAVDACLRDVYDVDLDSSRPVSMPDTLAAADRRNINHVRAVEFDAVCNLVSFWQRQTAKLQKQLRNVLESDLVTDPAQRQAVIESVYGRWSASRDGSLLTPAERKLVDDYRAMDAGDRQAARTIFDRLAAVARGECEKGAGA